MTIVEVSSSPDFRVRLSGLVHGRTTYLTLLGVILALVVYTSVRTDVFLTTSNLRNILLQSSVLAVAAAGMTILMVSGGIDLSIGSMASVSGIVAASMMRDGTPIVLAALVAILVATLIGGGNGLLAAWSPSHPFIVTLGVAILLRGVAISLSDGLPISGIPRNFTKLSSDRLLGVPLPVWVAVVVVAFVSVLLRYTVLGRRTYALGGNERAATLAGIRPKLMKPAIYAINGALIGVASLLLTARISSASAFMGDGLELRAIAAVAVGGTPLAGGRGGILGTMLGVVLLGVIANSLNLLGIDAAYQSVLEGAVIIVAVMTQRSRA